MQDLELKRFLVINKLDKLFRNYQYAEYHFMMTGEELPQLKIFKEEILPKLNEDQIRVINNLNQTRRRKIKRCKDFIQKMFNISNMLDFKVVFLTLTFNDIVLNSTTELARRKRVKRFIQKNCIMAVSNIDFGEKNEREHYHVVALLRDSANLDTWQQKNGFYNCKPVNLEDDDKVKLGRYLNKLTYHAIKDTTQHENSSYRCSYYNTLKK